ncbi:MAG: hypothetical protein ACYDEB_01635 [Dehalococcoidia bacterium]
MMDQVRTPTPRRKPAPRPARIAELRTQLDARDETIRLLNEALSRALEELDRSGDLAA